MLIIHKKYPSSTSLRFRQFFNISRNFFWTIPIKVNINLHNVQSKVSNLLLPFLWGDAFFVGGNRRRTNCKSNCVSIMRAQWLFIPSSSQQWWHTQYYTSLLVVRGHFLTDKYLSLLLSVSLAASKYLVTIHNCVWKQLLSSPDRQLSVWGQGLWPVWLVRQGETLPPYREDCPAITRPVSL